MIQCSPFDFHYYSEFPFFFWFLFFFFFLLAFSMWSSFLPSVTFSFFNFLCFSIIFFRAISSAFFIVTVLGRPLRFDFWGGSRGIDGGQFTKWSIWLVGCSSTASTNTSCCLASQSIKKNYNITKYMWIKKLLFKYSYLLKLLLTCELFNTTLI